MTAKTEQATQDSKDLINPRGDDNRDQRKHALTTADFDLASGLDPNQDKLTCLSMSS